MLEEYRKTILSQIVGDWSLLSDEEKSTASRMNNFFCSLHLLVNFADVCGEALHKFESLYLKDQDDSGQSREDTVEPDLTVPSESGTIRLLQTASKAFGKGVDEKKWSLQIIYYLSTCKK